MIISPGGGDGAGVGKVQLVLVAGAISARLVLGDRVVADKEPLGFVDPFVFPGDLGLGCSSGVGLTLEGVSGRKDAFRGDEIREDALPGRYWTELSPVLLTGGCVGEITPPGGFRSLVISSLYIHGSRVKNVSAKREAITRSNSVCSSVLSGSTITGLVGGLKSSAERELRGLLRASFARDCIEAEEAARSRIGRC